MVQKSRLPNGLTIVTESAPEFSSVCVGVWINVGSKQEANGEDGMSHFIEHMMFRGTRHHAGEQIAEITDEIGGSLDAFTEKEHTCYYARVMDRHLAVALDVLLEMLVHSSFHPHDIEREKGVILEEIRFYEDTPHEVVFDLLAKTVLGSHPLARSTLGAEQAIRCFGRETLLKHVERFYRPHNMLVAAAGRLHHQEIEDRVRQHMGSLEAGGAAWQEPPLHTRQGNLLRFRDCEQAYLCVGVPSLSQRDDRKYALLTLDSILGGSRSSRLAQTVRESRGLAYNASTFHNAYADTGMFGVFAGTSPRNLPEVLRHIRDILAELRSAGVTEKEVRRAREHLKSALCLACESTSSRMIRLAKNELYYGRSVSIEEVLDKLDAVTARDVHHVARALLAEERQSAIVLGPVREPPWGESNWQIE